MFDIEETELKRKLVKLWRKILDFRLEADLCLEIEADLCLPNKNFIKRLDKSIYVLSDVTQEVKQEVRKRKNNLWKICTWCMFIQELYDDILDSLFKLSLITRKNKCSKQIIRNKLMDARDVILEIRYRTCDEICRLTEEKIASEKLIE